MFRQQTYWSFNESTNKQCVLLAFVSMSFLDYL